MDVPSRIAAVATSPLLSRLSCASVFDAADFGLARELALLMTANSGTFPFMAPERQRPSCE